MQTEDIPIFRKDERGIIYRCGSVNYIVRKKGTISAGHTHEEPETIYLIEGEAELTIGKETKNVEAPVKFYVPSNEYHKLVALTDIKLIRV
jgi:quercetin dioxygenase-like cupin family protein